MGKRKQGRGWDNSFHEEALQRRRENNYMKYKKSVSEKVQSTETPIDMNEEKHNDKL